MDTSENLAHSDFLFDCYMRYTNTLMYVCMYLKSLALALKVGFLALALKVESLLALILNIFY